MQRWVGYPLAGVCQPGPHGGAAFALQSKEGFVVARCGVIEHDFEVHGASPAPLAAHRGNFAARAHDPVGSGGDVEALHYPLAFFQGFDGFANPLDCTNTRQIVNVLAALDGLG